MKGIQYISQLKLVFTILGSGSYFVLSKLCKSIGVSFFKADLDGTTFAYNCRMRFLERALLASCKKSHTTLVTQHCLYLRTIVVGF